MKTIKNIVKNSFKVVSPTYRKLDSVQKDIWRVKSLLDGKSGQSVSESNKFINRQKGYDSMLIVLAGYKEQLWDNTIKRIKTFIPEKIDVCIVTSGTENKYLIGICEKYGWSYLSTKVNNISLAQNIAIDLHPNAEWIYKLDEDMFVTEGFFETMKETYQLAIADHFVPGFVGPLIPINGYGYIRILQELNLVNEFELRFGKAAYSDGLTHHRNILLDADLAKFMWGSTTDKLKSIDELNQHFRSLKQHYSICPIRFSIGAVLFKRSAWVDWGRFPVPAKGNGLGLDEETMCWASMRQSKVIIVSENSVVGHLGFGPQTEEMMKYYFEHKKQFEI